MNRLTSPSLEPMKPIGNNKSDEKKPFLSRSTYPKPSHSLTQLRQSTFKTHILNEEALNDLIKMINPSLKLDNDVLIFFQDMITDYITESIEEMALYARHRGGDTVDFKDAKLFYEQHFHHSLPAILSVYQQSNAPLETLVKSIRKCRKPTEKYINNILDFKKGKK